MKHGGMNLTIRRRALCTGNPIIRIWNSTGIKGSDEKDREESESRRSIRKNDMRYDEIEGRQ